MQQVKSPHGYSRYINHTDTAGAPSKMWNFPPKGRGQWQVILPLKKQKNNNMDPYHTEFVSWRVDNFSFFSLFFSTRGGRCLMETSTDFFLILPCLIQGFLSTFSLANLFHVLTCDHDPLWSFGDHPYPPVIFCDLFGEPTTLPLIGLCNIML